MSHRMLSLTILVAMAPPAVADAPVEIRLTFPKQALATPFTGRVFVIVSKPALGAGPARVNWLKPEPFFAQDVKNWLPDIPLLFQPIHAFPEPFAKLPAGKYHVQAVLDRDLGGQNCMTSPGNLFSKPLTVEIAPAKGAALSLTIDQVVPPRKFEEKPRVKLVDIDSKLLTQFHGKPMRLRAGIALPKSFRDFQLVNIYEPNTNIFTDAKGQPRPLARREGKVAIHYKPFSDMEVVMGRGGQLQSFEAVFSPRGADGRPAPLWNRSTGHIDAKVAEAWKQYDIRLILEKNWLKLSPKLAGKLHVYMGAEDTFYLDGAARLLKDSLKNLGSGAVVEIFPGRDHGNLLDAALRKRIAGEMAERFRQGKS